MNNKQASLYKNKATNNGDTNGRNTVSHVFQVTNSSGSNNYNYKSRVAQNSPTAAKQQSQQIRLVNNASPIDSETNNHNNRPAVRSSKQKKVGSSESHKSIISTNNNGAR